MADKSIKKETAKLIEQIKLIRRPANKRQEYLMINLYNSMVIGIHNYYQYATLVNHDCNRMAKRVNTALKNRLGKRLKMAGNLDKGYIKSCYGKSEQLRFCDEQPIIPIGYVQKKDPMHLKRSICSYTPEGRASIHKSLEKINMSILHALMRTKEVNRSIEYTDNRISLYSAQRGKCAVTGKVLELNEIHCHHKLPVNQGGTDRYQNLVIVHKLVHRLIHATREETVKQIISQLNLDKAMLAKVNKLREAASLAPIGE